MSELVGATRRRSISIDRTGGRTGSGFEFEDLEIEGGEYEFVTIVQGRAERPMPTPQYRAVEALLTANQEFAVDVVVRAINTAIDQILPRESLEKKQFYQAITATLHSKIGDQELAMPLLQREILTAEDEVTYERHETQEAISRFLKVLTSTAQSHASTNPIYTDEELGAD